MIYFDYNATAPVDPRVTDAMKPYWQGGTFGNPSSLHRAGQEARHAIERAREILAGAFEVDPGDLVWTSGGTEADNLAVLGGVRARRPERDHLVVSSIEHPAVLGPARQLESEGVGVSVVGVGADGIVDLKELERVVTRRTALVSLMHANNEIGTIQPVAEAARIARAAGAWFHTDAVQSFGKLDVRPEELGADLVSVSSHKICGPKGAGALYVKKGLRIRALQHGGHQEKNVRPGTENVACIAGFGEAARLALEERGRESERVSRLRDRLEDGLRCAVTGVRFNGDRQRRLPGTSSVTFENLDGEAILIHLDLAGICASTGSACTAGSVEPSHVLLALGLDDRLARGTVRFSLGRFTTEAEVDSVLEALPPILGRLRESSTSRPGARR